jgi:protein tyrosine phosphatase
MNLVEDTRVVLQTSKGADSYINANFVHVKIKFEIIIIESSWIRQEDDLCLRSKR